MKHLLYLLFTLLPLSASAQDDFFYIFLCFGQSNMVGQGVITPADSILEDGFLSLSAVDGPDGRRVGEWRKALPPLCRANTGLSLVDYFGRTIRRNFPLKVKVGVVYVAVDGCAIDLFDKDACQAHIDTIKADWMLNEIAAYGGNPYKRLVDMARKAQEKGVIRGILLHQGETDAYNDRWLQKVKKIYGDLMTDLHLDPKKVPLIAGETVGEDQHGVCAHANPTINRLPEVLPNSYVVSSKGCQAGPDKVHFSADGYRELGRRYGVKMLQALGFEVGDGHAIESGSAQVAPAANDFDVDYTLDGKGILHVSATGPMTKMEYVSFSGKVLSTLDMAGKSTADIDTKRYPDEKHLILVFYNQSGASVSVDITR